MTFNLKGDNVTVYNIPIILSSITITRIVIIRPRIFLKDIPPFEVLYHGYYHYMGFVRN